MTSLAERLNEAFTKAKKTQPHLTKAQLAKHCGVRPSTVTDWFKGTTRSISGNDGLKVAELLGVSATWLIAGIGAMYENTQDEALNPINDLPADLIGISLYTVEFLPEICDPNDFVLTKQLSCEKIWYSESWFRERGLAPVNCKCLIVRDSSQEPMIWDGDTIMVDCSKKPIVSGKIYAFVLNRQMHIKYLYPMLDGSLLVKSLNPGIPDEIIKKATPRIIGRVRHREGSRLL